MELKNYINILLHWAWLLILCLVLGATCGFVVSRNLKPTYQASTKILISKDLLDQNSQFASMNNQQLVQTYVELLTTTNLTDEVSHRLGFKIDVQNSVQVQQIQTTSVIQILTEDTNPERAALIANTLADVLIEQNAQSSGYVSTEESLKKRIGEVDGQIAILQTQINQINTTELQDQLKQLDVQITALEDEILNLHKEIAAIPPSLTYNAEKSASLAEKQARLDQLQPLLVQYQQIRTNLEYTGKPTLNVTDQGGDVRLQQLLSTLDMYQKTYLNLLDKLETVQLAHLGNTPTIVQIEKATPPLNPLRPLPLIYTMLAGTLGLMLGIGAVFIIEYLDDTLKTHKDIRQTLEVPVLGSIVNTQSAPITKPIEGQLYSLTSEALYALRTNLELAVPRHPLKTLLLLSINEFNNSKTNLAADLAVNYAQSGIKVFLVDADLRNPSIHSYFGLVNENGLSDLLADDSKTEAAGKKIEGLDGMTIITAGNTSPAMVGSLKPEKIGSILKILRQQSDVIIIDAPSIKAADSWVLASKVDGVLLVIQPRVTHRAFALKSMEQLYLAGATIIGAVLYQNPHDLAYYFRKIRDNYWSYNWPKWSFWHANNP